MLPLKKNELGARAAAVAAVAKILLFFDFFANNSGHLLLLAGRAHELLMEINMPHSIQMCVCTFISVCTKLNFLRSVLGVCSYMRA